MILRKLLRRWDRDRVWRPLKPTVMASRWMIATRVTMGGLMARLMILLLLLPLLLLLLLLLPLLPLLLLLLRVKLALARMLVAVEIAVEVAAAVLLEPRTGLRPRPLRTLPLALPLALALTLSRRLLVGRVGLVGVGVVRWMRGSDDG